MYVAFKTAAGYDNDGFRTSQTDALFWGADGALMEQAANLLTAVEKDPGTSYDIQVLPELTAEKLMAFGDFMKEV